MSSFTRSLLGAAVGLACVLQVYARAIPHEPLTTPLALREIRSDSRPARNPFDDYTNVRINSDNSGEIQNEEQACISPIDSNVFVAVWRDFRLGYRQVGVGYSHDAGLTWTDALFPPMYYPWQSDPLLVVDNDGTFTANVITYDPVGECGLLQVSSYDGGVTWQDSVWAVHGPDTAGFTDKQMLTIDLSGSEYNGTYYCTWTHFYDSGPTHIWMVYKRPGQPFGPPHILSQTPGVQWSNVCVGADGEVYVTWLSYQFSAIMFSRSMDGGDTWSPEEVLMPTNFVLWELEPNTEPNDFLVFAYGALACDVTDGPNRGRLYMVFTDITPNMSETDIWFIYSDDQGVNWSDPVKIDDEPEDHPIDQFHPWISVDEEGRVWVEFYDRRDDPNNLLMNTYFTVSTDGGATWRPNERISTVSSDPGVSGSLDAGQIGEYIGWQARGGKALAVWTDTRDGSQDVYSALVDSVFVETSAEDPVAPVPASISVAAYPNPTNSQTTISYYLPSTAPVKIQLFDVTGRQVRTIDLGQRGAGSYDYSLDLDGLASGIYFTEVSAGNISARTKLVLLK